MPLLVRRVLLGLGLFLTGATLAFAYSYRPLHGALVWKVEQLEARLDARNRDNLALRDEIAALQTQDTPRIEPEAFEDVEQELDRTRRALTKATEKLTQAERQRRDANATADRWRKRYEDLREAHAHAAAPPPAQPSPPAAKAIPDERPREDERTAAEGLEWDRSSTLSPERGMLSPSEAPDLP